MHAIQHFAHGKRLQIRPKVFCAIPGNFAHDFHPRVIFFEIDAHIGVVLVVPQQDIIVRLVFLNQVALQNERFLFAVCDDIFKIRYFIDHRIGLGVFYGVGPKILADAVL